MKRSLALLLLAPAFAVPTIAASTTAADAAPDGNGCQFTWRSANAAQWTCDNNVSGFQFRTVVKCKRPGLPNFSYQEYGPYRNANGSTSAAYCDRQSNDYRVDDFTQGFA